MKNKIMLTIYNALKFSNSNALTHNMRRIRNIGTCVILGAVAAFCITGCGNGASTGATADKSGEKPVAETPVETAANSSGEATDAGSKKLSIVTTIFPEYDWVNVVLGEKAADADVTMLLDKGVDLHSYQPTAEDILKISNADVFIYVGGESDEWVEDALKEAVNPDQKVIDLLEVLGGNVKEEEIVEGMEAGHDHDHEHGKEEEHQHNEAEEASAHEEAGHNEAHEDAHEEAGHDEAHEDAHEEAGHDEAHEEAHEEDHQGEVEYDEHVWLSLKNAEVLCGAIADALAEADSDNADLYKANAEAYTKKLSELDSKYADAVKGAKYKTVLFGDRFPFRYMTDDYGIDYYAAFAGCSAETEASFETIIFLAGKVDELKLPAILTIENSDGKIAETIRDNTQSKDQKILSLDSMQSTAAEDVKNGAGYLGIMEKNLEVLKEAMN